MAGSLEYSTLLAFSFVHLIILFSGIGIPIVLFNLDNIFSELKRASLSISFYLCSHLPRGNWIGVDTDFVGLEVFVPLFKKKNKYLENTAKPRTFSESWASGAP